MVIEFDINQSDLAIMIMNKFENESKSWAAVASKSRWLPKGFQHFRVEKGEESTSFNLSKRQENAQKIFKNSVSIQRYFFTNFYAVEFAGKFWGIETCCSSKVNQGLTSMLQTLRQDDDFDLDNLPSQLERKFWK